MKQLLLTMGDSYLDMVGPDLNEALTAEGYEVRSTAQRGLTAHELALGEVERPLVLGPPGVTAFPNTVRSISRLDEFDEEVGEARKSAAGFLTGVVVCVGGNDAIRALPAYLDDRELVSAEPQDLLLDHAGIFRFMEQKLYRYLRRIIDSANASVSKWYGSRRPVVLVGYPYPRLGAGGALFGLVGPWIEPTLRDYHYLPDRDDEKRELIAKSVTDSLNTTISWVADDTGSIFVDLRWPIAGDMHADELHLNKKATLLAARLIRQRLIPDLGSA